MSTCLPIMKPALLLAATQLFVTTAPAPALDRRAEIDPVVQPLLDDGRAVGLVVGIYWNGETQVIGYGETAKGQGVPPDGDTMYEIGSASKVFTGALLADLVLRGRVNLDDPIERYLPAAAQAQLKNSTRITFEHLAAHTSGLPRLPDNLQPADPLNPYADYTFQRMFAFLKDHQPQRDPGEYEYSNFGMGLLGVLLASRERTAYEQLMVERIAKPCGMVDTCVTLSPGQRQRLAPPYDAALQPAKNWDAPALGGAGGIRSTANDMLKFIAANLAADDQPLTKAFHLAHQQRHEMPDGGAIGLAWHIAGDGVTRWHNGMTGGYACWVAVIPGHRVGVVVLSNTAAEQITEIGAEITRIAFGVNNGPAAAPPDESEYPKLAPFAGVRWDGDTPVVKIGGRWFKLVSLDGLAAADIVAFSRRTYQEKWQQRFEEDLVEVLASMGREPQRTVRLVVSPEGSAEERTLDNVPMTEANRQAIKAAARNRPSRQQPRPAVDVSPELLAKYAGVYAISPQFALTITRSGNQLAVQATGQQPFQLSPESESKFSCQGVDAQITFAGEKNGKAEMLILHQNGANQVAMRQD